MGDVGPGAADSALQLLQLQCIVDAKDREIQILRQSLTSEDDSSAELKQLRDENAALRQLLEEEQQYSQTKKAQAAAEAAAPSAGSPPPLPSRGESEKDKEQKEEELRALRAQVATKDAAIEQLSAQLQAVRLQLERSQRQNQHFQQQQQQEEQQVLRNQAARSSSLALVKPQAPPELAGEVTGTALAASQHVQLAACRSLCLQAADMLLLQLEAAGAGTTTTSGTTSTTGLQQQQRGQQHDEPSTAGGGDVLELNVSGTVILVPRPVLEQAPPGSRLAQLATQHRHSADDSYYGRDHVSYSQQQQQQQQQTAMVDGSGRPYLPYDPRCFQALVAQLQELFVFGATSVQRLRLDPDFNFPMFCRLAAHLGVAHLLALHGGAAAAGGANAYGSSGRDWAAAAAATASAAPGAGGSSPSRMDGAARTLSPLVGASGGVSPPVWPRNAVGGGGGSGSGSGAGSPLVLPQPSATAARLIEQRLAASAAAGTGRSVVSPDGRGSGGGGSSNLLNALLQLSEGGSARRHGP